MWWDTYIISKSSNWLLNTQIHQKFLYSNWNRAKSFSQVPKHYAKLADRPFKWTENKYSSKWQIKRHIKLCCNAQHQLERSDPLTVSATLTSTSTWLEIGSVLHTNEDVSVSFSSFISLRPNPNCSIEHMCIAYDDYHASRWNVRTKKGNDYWTELPL